MDRIKIKKIIMCSLMGVFAEVFAGIILGFILEAVPGAAEGYSADIAPLVENAAFVIIRVAVLAPAVEELIFRLLMQTFLRRRFPFFAANIIQAALFGIYHMKLIQGIYAFLLGLLLGLLKEETGMISACIGFHVAFNITGLLIDDLMPDNIPPVIQAVMMIISLAVCVILLLRIRTDKPVYPD